MEMGFQLIFICSLAVIAIPAAAEVTKCYAEDGLLPFYCPGEYHALDQSYCCEGDRTEYCCDWDEYNNVTSSVIGDGESTCVVVMGVVGSAVLVCIIVNIVCCCRPSRRNRHNQAVTSSGGAGQSSTLSSSQPVPPPSPTNQVPSPTYHNNPPLPPPPAYGMAPGFPAQQTFSAGANQPSHQSGYGIQLQQNPAYPPHSYSPQPPNTGYSHNY